MTIMNASSRLFLGVYSFLNEGFSSFFPFLMMSFVLRDLYVSVLKMTSRVLLSIWLDIRDPSNSNPTCLIQKELIGSHEPMLTEPLIFDYQFLFILRWVTKERNASNKILSGVMPKNGTSPKMDNPNLIHLISKQMYSWWPISMAIAHFKNFLNLHSLVNIIVS